MKRNLYWLAILTLLLALVVQGGKIVDGRLAAGAADGAKDGQDGEYLFHADKDR